MNYTELINRIEELKSRKGRGSISADETFSLLMELAEKTKAVDINAGSLTIRRVYTTVAAMNADKNPVDQETGKPLKFGQLACVCNSNDLAQTDNGKIYRYNKPGWEFLRQVGDMVQFAKTEEVSNKIAQIEQKKIDIGGFSMPEGNYLFGQNENNSIIQFLSNNLSEVFSFQICFSYKDVPPSSNGRSIVLFGPSFTRLSVNDGGGLVLTYVDASGTNTLAVLRSARDFQPKDLLLVTFIYNNRRLSIYINHKEVFNQNITYSTKFVNYRFCGDGKYSCENIVFHNFRLYNHLVDDEQIKSVLNANPSTFIEKESKKGLIGNKCIIEYNHSTISTLSWRDSVNGQHLYWAYDNAESITFEPMYTGTILYDNKNIAASSNSVLSLKESLIKDVKSIKSNGTFFTLKTSDTSQIDKIFDEDISVIICYTPISNATHRELLYYFGAEVGYLTINPGNTSDSRALGFAKSKLTSSDVITGSLDIQLGYSQLVAINYSRKNSTIQIFHNGVLKKTYSSAIGNVTDFRLIGGSKTLPDNSEYLESGCLHYFTIVPRKTGDELVALYAGNFVNYGQPSDALLFFSPKNYYANYSSHYHYIKDNVTGLELLGAKESIPFIIDSLLYHPQGNQPLLALEQGYGFNKERSMSQNAITKMFSNQLAVGFLVNSEGYLVTATNSFFTTSYSVVVYGLSVQNGYASNDGTYCAFYDENYLFVGVLVTEAKTNITYTLNPSNIPLGARYFRANGTVGVTNIPNNLFGYYSLHKEIGIKELSTSFNNSQFPRFETNKALKVLFIGSSTLMNTAQLVKSVAEASGVKSAIGNLYAGGGSYQMYVNGYANNTPWEFREWLSNEFLTETYPQDLVPLNNPKEIADHSEMLMLGDAIRLRDWDIIITQQGLPNSPDFNSMIPWANKWLSIVRSECPNKRATIVVNIPFMPDKNSPDFPAISGCTTQVEAENKTTRAYKKLCNILGVNYVIPTLNIYRLARMSPINNGVGLTNGDLMHADERLGKYLLALGVIESVYRPIYGLTAKGNTYRDLSPTMPGSTIIDESNAKIAQNIVELACSNCFDLSLTYSS